MTSSIDRVGKVLGGKQIHPFDFVNNPMFYDPKPEPGTEYAERLLAQTKLANIAGTEVSKGQKKLFVPCAMSNGFLAYELALDYADKIRQATEARFGAAYLTTQSLRQYVAGSELSNRVILPNRLANHALIDRLERKFPGHAIFGPVDSEGPLRVQRGNNALAQGASFQDWTFENRYLPRLLECDGMVLGLDHVWSRYANVEELIGDVIQCGLLDKYRDQPGATFDIMDENGKHITLADRAWERAKHIVAVTEKGFRTDLAVGTLLAQFQLDDWLRKGKGPIDAAKVHPVLADRAPEEMKRMERLKALMLPYIAAKCLDGLPYEDDKNLKAYVERSVLPLQGTAVFGADVAKELFAYRPVGGFTYPDAKAPSALSAHFSTSARAPKRRGTEGNYFQTPAALFDDRHFAKLPIWEQAALPYIVGFMEDHRIAESAPRALLLVQNAKGGERARAFADARNITWLREAQSAEDPVDSKDSFYKSVIAPNVKDTENTQNALTKTKALRDAGFGNVLSTLNFQTLKKALTVFRKGIAADGSDTLSSKGFLAMMMEWFDRNAEGLALQKGWENHHEDVQMVVRAVQHACGLVDRPYEGGKYRMDIYQVDANAKNKKDQLKRQDLHDLITTLGGRVESYLDANAAHLAADPENGVKDAPAPARAEILALARLLQISDMRADPGTMNYESHKNPTTGAVTKTEIIEWHNVDQGLFWFWHQDPVKRADLLATPVSKDGAANDNGAQSMRDRLRGKLLETGVLFLTQEDLQGLHVDYEAAWRAAQGKDMDGKRRLYEGRDRKIGWNGPA
jgi:hypothetical protein